MPPLETSSSSYVENIPDKRQEGKVVHRSHDVVLSAVAMMFFQDPSLLRFQELQRSKELERFYVAAIDGSGYFGSEKIHCPGCLTKRKGSPRYEHQIVRAAIVHPGKRQVVPLAPEEVSNTDGADKQDCEITAGKRLVRNLRKDHPRLPLIIVADSLYSKQPFIGVLAKEHMHYVLVAKEEDHKVLMEYVEGERALKEVSRLEAKDARGRQHVYEWIDGVPLNGNEDASVNRLSYELHDKGKRTYHNAWVLGE